MRWEQTEFLLKGIYLGLLLVVALQGPSWQQLAQVGLITLAGLVFCLGVAAFRKMREGYRIQGRFLGFLLFLLLENPGLVYAGLIMGLAVGTFTTFRPVGEGNQEQDWNRMAPVLGGAVLGVLFYFLRLVPDRKIRLWLGLALAVALVGGTVAWLHFQADLLLQQQQMLGYVLLLGLPGFYLLTFSSLVEESEVEIAAMCGALGAGLWSIAPPQLGTVSLVVPLLIYYLYTRRILPGLRVFKHALRGMSYTMVGQYRPALASLNRALQLNPNHALAREQMWYLHRQMNVDQLKSDPETLALVNFDLCLERVAWLLLLDKLRPEHLQEADRLLELVASQRPALEPICAYWRTVALLHRRDYEEAAKNLESILHFPAEEGATNSAQRRSILFQAWHLALVLHPEMKKRVGTPLLAQPGCRLEAIAAVERRLAVKPEDQDAWDLKRLLYSDLTETDYDAGIRLLCPSPSAGGNQDGGEFDYAYVQQLGLALVENPARWQRGCEFLRLAARGMPADAPSIFIQIGKIHEHFGDQAGLWDNYQKAMAAGRAVGVANLKAENRQDLFAVVKQLGEQAMAAGKIDDALEAFKFFTQNDRAGLETYRTLAELFERKGDVWMALHCTEHALSYDGTDKDLQGRKDRYYYSLPSAQVKERWENIAKWFDFDYCLQKTRWLLERYNGDLDLLDWAGHLAELAQTAKPKDLSPKVLRARIHRIRGEIAESVALLEDVRQNKPEKFASNDEEEAWFLAHRLLGDMYLDEKPDQAIPCFLEYRKSERSGADTLFKLGRAYENVSDYPRAARCYEQVTTFEEHPLFYDAQAGLERVKRHPVG